MTTEPRNKDTGSVGLDFHWDSSPISSDWPTSRLLRRHSANDDHGARILVVKSSIRRIG